MGILVRQMMEKQGVTEELKARDQMVWVGVVNNIRNAAEEIIYNTLKKAGMNHDEGPDIDGGVGPYVQSERQAQGLVEMECMAVKKISD